MMVEQLQPEAQNAAKGPVPDTSRRLMSLVTCSKEKGIEQETEKDANLTVPLRFRLSGSPNGKPDLQLQLLRLDFGADARSSSVDRRQGSRKLLTDCTAHGEEPDPENFVRPSSISQGLLYAPVEASRGLHDAAVSRLPQLHWSRPLSLHMMFPANETCVCVSYMH